MPVDATHAFADGAVFPRPKTFLMTGLVARLLSALVVRSRIAKGWKAFERNAELGPDCRLGPSAWCVNHGPRDRVQIGARTVCRGILRREAFGDGALVVGNQVYIGDDCIISCCDRVEIGDLTLLGHGVQIFDNNSHPLDVGERETDWLAVSEDRGMRPEHAIDHAPVTIGRGVWIGFGSVVLRGVNVGDGAVVAAMSVVTNDVPPHTVAAGIPATTVRSLH